MSTNAIANLLRFLAKLREAHIYYRLSDPTEEAIMVEVSVPGERWEIEFHEDGRVSTEAFLSQGVLKNGEALDDLLRRFSD